MIEFRDLKKQYSVLQRDIDKAVLDVMQSSRFIMGAPVCELEEKLADYVGVKHCISCANGTDALEIALMAWDIGPGDAVFVPDFSFFASAEVIALRGAHPVFVDIDMDTFNMGPIALENAIKATIDAGIYTPRVVISVDLFGQPADYKAIKPICEKYNLLLLEDAAQAFGGSADEKKCCFFGDVSTTSFFPSKPLGCYGDGGAIFTNNDEYAEIIRSIRVHGQGNNKYDNVRVGLNSRLDTLQAAILLVKLRAFVDYEMDAANSAALQYTERLRSFVKTPTIKYGNSSSWAQYSILLGSNVRRDGLMSQLRATGIPSMIFYESPLHRQKAFGGVIANCPNTEFACERVLSLPMHPYLCESDINIICGVIDEYFSS